MFVVISDCPNAHRDTGRRARRALRRCKHDATNPRIMCTHNLPTNTVDFRGFDSSIILILRGGILMSTGDFPESLNQAMLVGTMLVGRLGKP